jgi:hypothetical protein
MPPQPGVRLFDPTILHHYLDQVGLPFLIISLDLMHVGHPITYHPFIALGILLRHIIHFNFIYPYHLGSHRVAYHVVI